MNYGRFFVLDLESSDLAKGVAVFNYRSVKAYEHACDSITPKYPFFLTITKDAIEFKVHYTQARLKEGEDYDKNRHLFDSQGIHITPQTDADFPKDKLDSIHVEAVVLSLPLSSDLDVKDLLTGAIKRAYSVGFPCSEKQNDESADEGNYLIRLIDWKKLKPTDEDDKGISFSSLPVFGIYSEKGKRNRAWMKQQKKETDYDTDIREKGQINKFLRKLLLDFMFDLEHTDVFKNAANYEEFAIKLRGNFFFVALMSKANFYYYRAVLEKELTENRDDPTFALKKMKFQAAFLDSAEKRWIEALQHPLANKEFPQLHSWYRIDDRLFRKEKNNRFQGWFADPETELNRVYYTEKKHNINTITINRIINKWQYPVKKVLIRIVQLIIMGVLPLLGIWTVMSFIKRWLFAAIPVPWEVSPVLFCSLLVLCIVSLFAYIKMSGSARGLEQRLENTSQWCIRRYDFVNTSLHCGRWPVGYWGMIALFGWFFSYISWGDLSYGRYVLVAVSLLIIIYNVVVNLYYKLLPVAFFSGPYRYFRGVHILLPRLAAAIVTAWITITLSEDMFKAFFDLSHRSFPITTIMLTVVMLVFVYFEIGKIVPYLSPVKRLFRSASLLLIGFFYAVITGFLFIAFSADRFIERSDYLDDFYANKVLVKDSEYSIQNPGIFMMKEFYATIVKQFKPELRDSVVHVVNNYEGEVALTAPYQVVEKQLKEYKTEISNYNRFTALTFELIKSYTEETKGTNEKNDAIYEHATISHVIQSKIKRAYTRLDSLKNIPTAEIAMLKTDASLDSLCKRFLICSDNHQIYRRGLAYLRYTPKSGKKASFNIAETFNIGMANQAEYIVLWDFLVQFAFVSMFIGIFLQLILEEKPITEPV